MTPDHLTGWRLLLSWFAVWLVGTTLLGLGAWSLWRLVAMIWERFA